MSRPEAFINLSFRPPDSSVYNHHPLHVSIEHRTPQTARLNCLLNICGWNSSNHNNNIYLSGWSHRCCGMIDNTEPVYREESYPAEERPRITSSNGATSITRIEEHATDTEKTSQTGERKGGEVPPDNVIDIRPSSHR